MNPGASPSSQSLEDYPVNEAFRAIDHFTLGQEGEPTIFTFGETIRHLAWVNVGQKDAMLPKRKTMLVGRWSSMHEMAVDLTSHTRTGIELDREAAERLAEQSEPYESPINLPRTSAQEGEIETFESHAIDLEVIKSTAKVRAQRQTSDSVKNISIVNASTGASRTIPLDAATLIASGELYVTRGLEERADNSGVVLHTHIEFGELLGRAAVSLGLSLEDLALVSQKDKHETLYPVDRIFGSDRSIANDFWSESGIYRDAASKPSGTGPPPYHSLRYGLNYLVVDDYDAEDFLDAAQAAVTHTIEHLRSFTGSESLILQPMDPLDVSFHALRKAVQKSGFELAYQYSPIIPSRLFKVAREDGWAKKYLDTRSLDLRVGVENSARAFDHWRKPAIVKAGRLLARQISGK